MHLHIYTDGSQIKKPYSPPKTGYGLYIREWDIKYSCYLPGANETNNRAELYAISHSLEMIIEQLPSKKGMPSYPTLVLVYTDSQYCLQVISKWILKPKTDVVIDAPNADLLGRLRTIYKTCSEMVPIKFLKVQAHTALTDEDKIGNHIADELANGAAMSGGEDTRGVVDKNSVPVFAFGKYKGMNIEVAGDSYMDWVRKEWEANTKWTQDARIRANIERIFEWKSSTK